MLLVRELRFKPAYQQKEGKSYSIIAVVIPGNLHASFPMTYRTKFWRRQRKMVASPALTSSWCMSSTWWASCCVTSRALWQPSRWPATLTTRATCWHPCNCSVQMTSTTCASPDTGVSSQGRQHHPITSPWGRGWPTSQTGSHTSKRSCSWWVSQQCVMSMKEVLCTKQRAAVLKYTTLFLLGLTKRVVVDPATLRMWINIRCMCRPLFACTPAGSWEDACVLAGSLLQPMWSAGNAQAGLLSISHRGP